MRHGFSSTSSLKDASVSSFCACLRKAAGRTRKPMGASLDWPAVRSRSAPSLAPAEGRGTSGFYYVSLTLAFAFTSFSAFGAPARDSWHGTAGLFFGLIHTPLCYACHALRFRSRRLRLGARKWAKAAGLVLPDEGVVFLGCGRCGPSFRAFWVIMSPFLLRPVPFISFEFLHFAFNISVRAWPS